MLTSNYQEGKITILCKKIIISEAKELIVQVDNVAAVV